jgi:SAM-dependent methyltransferase
VRGAEASVSEPSRVEGLGVVYERLVLNDLLLGFDREHGFDTVLEAPIYGMAGVDGINSVALAQAGKRVTLVDVDAGRARRTQAIWDELGIAAEHVVQPSLGPLPFADGSFDLVWNFAALWHAADAATLIREMARVSRKLVFIAMPNNTQIGYLLRKYAIDKEFFGNIDERWVSLDRVKRALEAAGATIIREGVVDVPPWPDTCMPASEWLRRMGITSKAIRDRFEGDGWSWSTLDYYSGAAPSLRQTVDRLTTLEHLPIPWQLKLVWAHHHYVLATVKRA